MAIEVAGKRFVTLADEFFVNGSKVYQAFANGVLVYPDGYPAYMKITTLPNKLVYKPGDTMYYTGIVCTLFNADGTVYMDERYPDGIIPFDELEFPIEKAPAVGMVYVTDGIPGGNMTFPIPLYPIAYQFYHRNDVSYIKWWYPDSDAYFVVNRIDDRRIDGGCVSARNGAYLNYDSDPSGYVTPGHYECYVEYTHDSKTAYYTSFSVAAYNYHFKSFFPESGSGPATGYINGVDAWNILYGTREGDDSSIPVNWQSRYEGDGRVLTDSFNISNREVIEL